LHRFNLTLPVWFRIDGESEWRTGCTERVSGSEVVIRAERPVPAVGTMSMLISLPSNAFTGGGCLVGSGRIKRLTARLSRRARSTFSVAIAGCRLDRLERAFPWRRR